MKSFFNNYVPGTSGTSGTNGTNDTDKIVQVPKMSLMPCGF
jgi:hypothetical protein